MFKRSFFGVFRIMFYFFIFFNLNFALFGFDLNNSDSKVNSISGNAIVDSDEVENFDDGSKISVDDTADGEINEDTKLKYFYMVFGFVLMIVFSIFFL